MESELLQTLLCCFEVCSKIITFSSQRAADVRHMSRMEYPAPLLDLIMHFLENSLRYLICSLRNLLETSV